MQLSDEQISFFDENGYLILPDLFSAEEVAALRREIERLYEIDCDEVFRRSECSTVYRVHEEDGKTASFPYFAAARMEKVLQPAQQVLRRDDLYVYNSKVNCKPATTGLPMLWHQDYGYWKLDRVPEPNLVTVMIALNDVDELAGELYVVPGSHRRGLMKHLPQMVGDHKQIAIERKAVRDALEEMPKPVALRGRAGMVALFHANTIHGSGHNLSPQDRWQCYFAYNPVDNKPGDTGRGRPEHMVSRNFTPLETIPDTAIREWMEKAR
jgi:ectoine hydroxylase